MRRVIFIHDTQWVCVIKHDYIINFWKNIIQLFLNNLFKTLFEIVWTVPPYIFQMNDRNNNYKLSLSEEI